MKKTINLFFYICCIACSGWLHAAELIITKSFTGGWYDPNKNGQGFLLEIIKSNNQKQALTTWFTFDMAGNQYWLIGVGNIEDQSIQFQMMLPEGGRFGDAHNPANMTNTYWGDVTFDFTDCNQGSVSWSPRLSGFEAGSMPITRSTIINNLNCTGGLFDELGDTLTETETITPLLSTGVQPGASGKTKYEQRTDRIDYSVEVEDVPVGIYQLFVGGIDRGEIAVTPMLDGSTEGEIEFRDPVEPGKLPLDFNPQDQVVDVVQNGITYLTSEGSGGNGGGTSQNAPPFGNSETERMMVNSGIIPLGQAKAKLEQRPDRVDFEVELEDVPTGFYDFNVNGITQGVIEVIQTATGLEGELEYRNPVEAGKQLLDFNPFGQFLSITQGSTVLFTLDFPATPGGGNNGGGNGGGNNQTIEIEVDFSNNGPDPDADGSVEYEARGDRTEFKVEVEDLDFGTYQLVVGGQIVASLEVDAIEAEWEFRDPVEPGKLLLDFDPLNQLIEIRQGGTVFLSAFLR